MDDQNIAVSTKAEGLRTLKEVGRSLGRLHLTPNSQKTHVLTLAEARRHYHLDLNRMLDEAESLAKKAPSSKTARLRFQRRVRAIWKEARGHEGVGEFGKILSRLYRLAGLAGLGFFRSRAARDILDNPSLVDRVADYYRCTGSVSEYLDFVEALMSAPEQVYSDVNIALIESLLRVEPNGIDLIRVRQLTRDLIRRGRALPGIDDCVAVGALLVLRFGDSRTRALLKRCFEDKKQTGSRPLVRAAAFVYASQSPSAFQEVGDIAAAGLRGHLSTLVRLIAEIQQYKSVPRRYLSRLNPSTDSVAGTKFVDMRVVLTARLLLLSPEQSVRNWVIDWRKRMVAIGISEYDRLIR